MDGTWGASTGIRTYKDMYEHGLGKYNTLYENLVTDENGQFVKDANGNYQTYRYKMADGSYWEKTTDNFYQNHNILSAVFTPSDHWSHNVAIHYTYGSSMPSLSTRKGGSPFSLATFSRSSTVTYSISLAKAATP